MPRVKSCCCGCTLRTGSRMILWFGVILVIVAILSTTSQIDQNVEFSLILKYVLIGAIVLGIHVIGIIGVDNDRPALLKPFLVYQVFSMVVIIIDMFVLAILGPVILSYRSGIPEGEGYTDEYAMAFLSYEIIHLIALGLSWYFFVVVLSFYKELKEVLPR